VCRCRAPEGGEDASHQGPYGTKGGNRPLTPSDGVTGTRVRLQLPSLGRSFPQMLVAGAFLASAAAAPGALIATARLAPACELCNPHIGLAATRAKIHRPSPCRCTSRCLCDAFTMPVCTALIRPVFGFSIMRSAHSIGLLIPNSTPLVTWLLPHARSQLYHV
jgi:hypothetical protein